MTSRCWIVAAALPWLFAAASVSAQPRGEAAQTASLDADSPEAVSAAIAELGIRGDRRAVTALRDRVRKGLPPALLLEAIEALGAVRRTDAAQALRELVAYRRPAVRTAVAKALAATGVRSASRTLSDLLDDPSPAVRAAAAEGLGELDPRSALPALLRAARNGLGPAAVVVGAHASSAQARAILRELRPEELEPLGPTLKGLAARDDLPRGTRLAVIAALGGIHRPVAHQLLQSITSALPEGDPIRVAANEALEASHETVARAAEGEGDASTAEEER